MSDEYPWTDSPALVAARDREDAAGRALSDAEAVLEAAYTARASAVGAYTAAQKDTRTAARLAEIAWVETLPVVDVRILPHGARKPVTTQVHVFEGQWWVVMPAEPEWARVPYARRIVASRDGRYTFPGYPSARLASGQGDPR